MSRRSPFEVRLSAEERAVLVGRASSRRPGTPRWSGRGSFCWPRTACRTWTSPGGSGVCVDVASKWRKRFCREGLAGLVDRPRSGRPRVFGSEVVAGIKALACEPPERRGVPLARWSSLELAAHAVSEGLVETISSSTVRRWLHGAAIKPWQLPVVDLSAGPRLRRQGGRVLDLYARVFDGVALGPGRLRDLGRREAQLQALRRCHPSLRPAPGRRGRVEHEYDRGGTLAYLGAYDVHRGPAVRRSPTRPGSCRSWSSSTRS